MRRLVLDDRSWADFVARRADATPFHDPAWAQLLAECYGLDGFVLASLDPVGAVEAGIPLLERARLPGMSRRLVSLPFTDALQPLAPPGGERRLAEAIEEHRRNAGLPPVELREALPGAHALPGDAVRHTLLLPPAAELLLPELSNSRRRNVRLAAAAGLTVHRADAERDLTETYYRMHVATRRRLGVPSQPRRFFCLLWRRMIEPGSGFALIARHQRGPLAGAVFLTGHDTVVYKFSASDGDRRHKPTELLLWAALQEACERGFARFDFGRSDGIAHGLREFKSSWGAVEEPLLYSTLGAAPGRATGSTPELAAGILRRGPLWMTRAAGELLYRYAA